MQTDPSWELQGEGIAAIAAAVAYFILRCIESVSICSSDVCDSMLSKQIWYLCDKSQDETPAPGVRLFCQSGELCSSSATTQAYGQQSAAAAAHAEIDSELCEDVIDAGLVLDEIQDNGTASSRNFPTPTANFRF
ncbi:hypothetical protein AXG93_4201s1210 [Marchantia polymorpha subsp. ruderalis]|uniref:Uncharacterized protein n=1 Tax=Marchantia polymorpha subsp. ruderalis TaxID=1480154 RepID=A0A176WAY5_MARPO|nr:hypothetical protein AXG93_4201s1210 [Marchantia polymorpha subsp. ruderalis]